jgi:SAM-dependent methyltransferase
MGDLLKKRLEEVRMQGYPRNHTDAFLSLLGGPYGKVLDVGCGSGFFSYVGAREKRFKQCFGSDIYNDYQTEEIGEFSETVSYEPIIDDRINFADDTFDLVMSVDVIEHVKDDKKFIGEKIRVAKSGGQIIVGTPNYYRLTSLLLIMIGRLKYPRNMGKDRYGDVIHLREYSKKDLLGLLEKYKDDIDYNNLVIKPCWLGIAPLNLGINKVPKFLERFCQYWFVSFSKK